MESLRSKTTVQIPRGLNSPGSASLAAARPGRTGTEAGTARQQAAHSSAYHRHGLSAMLWALKTAICTSPKCPGPRREPALPPKAGQAGHSWERRGPRHIPSLPALSDPSEPRLAYLFMHVLTQSGLSPKCAASTVLADLHGNSERTPLLPALQLQGLC